MSDVAPVRRWWRFRLTIRRLMVMVGLAAIILYYAIPLGKGLVWLASNRGSVMMFHASILPRTPLTDPPQANPANPMYRVDQPFRMEVTSRSKPADWIPAGLAYRIQVRVIITDPTTFTTIEATQQQSRWLFTGTPLPNEGWFTETFSLIPPKPGKFAVRYELWISDLFGRSSEDASATSYFSAQ